MLTRNQQQHEQELVEANLRRLQAILHSQQQNLLHSVLDYSQRDETLRFFHNRAPRYLNNNYTRNSLSTLRVDVVLFVSSTFQLLESLRFLDGTLQPIAESDELWQQIQRLLIKRPRQEIEGGLKLLLWSQGSAVQVGIAPVNDTEPTSPSAG